MAVVAIKGRACSFCNNRYELKGGPPLLNIPEATPDNKPAAGACQRLGSYRIAWIRSLRNLYATETSTKSPRIMRKPFVDTDERRNVPTRAPTIPAGRMRLTRSGSHS